MNHHLQLRMPGRVPLPQSLAHPRRDSGYDKAALSRNKATGQRRAVRDLWFAFGELGDIDVVEDRKARQIRGGIGGNCVRNRKDDDKKKREKAHGFLDGDEAESFTSFHLEEGTS